jgi:ATP-dependent DNA helicase RecG
MSKPSISKETRQRLELMTSTTDGFVVAEADLKFRGPGDLEGTMQSGLPIDLKLASLTTDGPIMELSRASAAALLDADPHLTAHPQQRNRLAQLFSREYDWARIS